MFHIDVGARKFGIGLIAASCIVIFRFVLFVGWGGGYFMNSVSRATWIYGILLIGICYIIRFWAACILWIIWGERKSSTFDGVERPFHMIKQL